MAPCAKIDTRRMSFLALCRRRDMRDIHAMRNHDLSCSVCFFFRSQSGFSEDFVLEAYKILSTDPLVDSDDEAQGEAYTREDYSECHLIN
jgi:hypothetical protein